MRRCFKFRVEQAISSSNMSPRAAVALMACFSLVTPPTLAVNVLSIVARRVLGLNDDSYSQASVSGEAMLVVGAGFGRTGTESLCAALSQLGFKTYHGSKALRHAHLPLWNNYFASLTSESPDSSVFDALENEGFNGKPIPIACFAMAILQL